MSHKHLALSFKLWSPLFLVQIFIPHCIRQFIVEFCDVLRQHTLSWLVRLSPSLKPPCWLWHLKSPECPFNKTPKWMTAHDIFNHWLNVVLCLFHMRKVLVVARLTDKGVLVELLQVWRGLWWSVDDPAIIDVGLGEIFHRCVRSVPMLDRTWGQAAQEGIHFKRLCFCFFKRQKAREEDANILTLRIQRSIELF